MDCLLICDSCVFLALWKEDDPVRQQLFSKALFETIEKTGKYSVLFTDLNQSEIRKKHPVYESAYAGLQERLCGLKKGKAVSLKDFAFKEKAAILAIRRGAAVSGFPDLSYADCTFFLAAKKYGAKLVTWENTLYDFAKEKNTVGACGNFPYFIGVFWNSSV